MVTKGRKKGTVKFSLTPSNGATKIKLAGDFSNWEEMGMRKQKDGCYAVTVPLDEGTYQYKFLVDGQWLLDPDNEENCVNEFGTMNSVVHVAQ